MAILYPIEDGAVNGITVDGVECKKTENGGFDIPDQHVADAVIATGGKLVSEKPATGGLPDEDEAKALRAKLKEAGKTFGPRTTIEKLREMVAALSEE